MFKMSIGGLAHAGQHKEGNFQVVALKIWVGLVEKDLKWKYRTL